MDDVNDVAREDSDDELKFTDDEDIFLMMIPADTMSQKIATESTASKVSFTWSMLNKLGDRLRNVPKNCQFRSPVDSKGRHPDVPLMKELALMKKCKKGSLLHRYDDGNLHHHLFKALSTRYHNKNRYKRLHACRLYIITITCSRYFTLLSRLQHQQLQPRYFTLLSRLQHQQLQHFCFATILYVAKSLFSMALCIG
jgi:hypothetical protein